MAGAGIGLRSGRWGDGWVLFPFFNARGILQLLQYRPSFTSLSNVSVGHKVRDTVLGSQQAQSIVFSWAQLSPLICIYSERAVENHLHLVVWGCCFWEQVKPRELFSAIIIFAVCFMRRCFFLKYQEKT